MAGRMLVHSSMVVHKLPIFGRQQAPSLGDGMSRTALPSRSARCWRLALSARLPARLPLVVTADPELLDELLRLAAAGGTDLDVAPDPAAARLRFAAAPLVLIGADQADACLRARLPRRPRVVIVGRAPAVETVWSVAELLGAEHVAMLPTAESWIIDRLTERHEQTTTSRVIAVIGGRGGAGASILAGGLAVTAVSAGLRTLLIDGDPVGCRSSSSWFRTGLEPLQRPEQRLAGSPPRCGRS
ncbi:MAG: hypothetical protein QOE51_4547 [Actinoplanes sp.]|jgi:hypothetical protein|nr:hypothetical protein [Actinoplanes sp.]